jgi:hypothetical protein
MGDRVEVCNFLEKIPTIIAGIIVWKIGEGCTPPARMSVI